MTSTAESRSETHTQVAVNLKVNRGGVRTETAERRGGEAGQTGGGAGQRWNVILKQLSSIKCCKCHKHSSHV